MIGYLFGLLLCEAGTTLAITRKTSGTIITAAGFNTNYTEVEAVVNGAIDSDTNIAADGVKAVALNPDVVRSGYGLSQHTDGTLQVDPSDTSPGLEISDGGVRVKVDDSSIERASGGIQVKAAGVTPAMLQYYPIAVGGIYISTVSTNPATLLGYGTWSAFGSGKVLVGLDSGDADFDTAEETGGEKTHTLTSDEMPAHTHSVTILSGGSGLGNGGNSNTSTSTTGSTGGGSAHNNLQPYIVVYMWKRTA